MDKATLIRCSAGSGVFTVTGLNAGNTVYLLSYTPPAIGGEWSYDFNVAGSPNNDFLMVSPSSNYFYENYSGTIAFNYSYAGPALPTPPGNGKFLLASNNASGGNQKAFTLSASTLSGGQSIKGYAYPGNVVSKLSIYDFNGGPTLAIKFKVKMQNASSSAGLWAFALGNGPRFQKIVVVNPKPVVSATAGAACARQSLQLAATPLNNPPLPRTYTWQGPENSSNYGANVSWEGLTAGSHTFTVTLTDGNNCQGETTVTAFVKPSPRISVSSNSPCANESLLINVSITQPTGSSLYYYNILGPGGWSAASTWNEFGANFTRNPAASGQYAVSVTDNNGCSESVTFYPDVFPVPAQPVIQPIAICKNGAATLTVNFATSPTVTSLKLYDTSSGGAPLQSFNFPSSPLSIDYGILTNSVTAYVELEGENGCRSGRQPVAITVDPLRTIPIPTISHNGPLCQNATLNLSVDPLGSHTYEWRSPAGANLGSAFNISISNVNTTAAGKYRLIAAYRGCTTYKDTPIDIIVPGMLPTFTSNSPVCDGQTLRLTASGGGGLSYVFSGPNGFSQTTSQPELTVPNVTAAHAGQYSLQVFTGACNSGISTLNVTVSDFLPSATFTTNSPVCLGSNITLTVTNYQSGVVYRLTDPRGVTENISIHPHVINNATPVNAGAYSLIAIAAGCTSRQVIQNVAVNNLPPPIVPVSQTVCVGNTLTLSVSNPAVGVTYVWAAPGGQPTYTGATWNRPNASAAMNGLYAVTASIAGCSTQVATTTVTAVSWQNLSVQTNAPLCSIGPLRLTASIAMSGATYQWNASNGQTYNTTSPTLEIPSAGPQHAAVYSLTASVPGCTSAIISTPYLI